MTKKRKDTILIGLALFAMFFGAGNLIFPPQIGNDAGQSWIASMGGFFITGIGLPLLGIIAVSLAGGEALKLANKVSPKFSKLLVTVIMLAIGPFLAIPRTGATAFEMGVSPLFPSFSPIIWSTIYFAVVILLAINPNGVIDKIGKILTPVLLAMLALIIVKGIINPIGTPVNTAINNPFTKGFTQGYQTMDALGSLVFAGIVISTIVNKGYKNRKEQLELTAKAGLIAAAGLTLVYGGLMYLGAATSGVITSQIGTTELTIKISEFVLGGFGKVAIGLTVSAACLTTAVGVTANISEYFRNLTKNKLGYKSLVVIISVFSAVISNAGVEQIIKISAPILSIIYPVAIVLILMNILDKFIPNKRAYKGAVYIVLMISIIDVFASMGIFNTYIFAKVGFNNEAIKALVCKLPYYDLGFGWLIPAILGGLLSVLIDSISNNFKNNRKPVGANR